MSGRNPEPEERCSDGGLPRRLPWSLGSVLPCLAPKAGFLGHFTTNTKPLGLQSTAFLCSDGREGPRGGFSLSPRVREGPVFHSLL